MSAAASTGKATTVPPERWGVWSDVVELKCPVQHYAWGDRRFIPALIGSDSHDARPCAELWMGAHPDAPSRVLLAGESTLLNHWIEADPERVLHPVVAARFGRQLPFLFKVLAAAAPLSLQVHPTKASAEAGFARENAAGLPPDSPKRNYRDANHKPELLVALTDFYGLRGFRELREIAGALAAAPEFRELASDFKPELNSLRKLYSRIMSATPKRVDAALGDFVRRLELEHRRWPFCADDWEYWLLRANCEHSHGGHHDRGLFAFLFLNLVHLKPGEAMFLPAGMLHAYLEGAAVEVMANSNNVLRGGLTSKHVDVQELLNNISFQGGDAEVIRPHRLKAETLKRSNAEISAGQHFSFPAFGSAEWIYPTPAREFLLSRIELASHQPHACAKDHAVAIFIVLSATGAVRVKTAASHQYFHRGQVFLITAGTHYELSVDHSAVLYRATVPLTESTPSLTVTSAEPLSFRGRHPTALAFGTSGLRGLVTDITDLEAYINTRGFLDYLCESGCAQVGDTVCVANDLRPSSDGPDRSIVRAVAHAIADAGFEVEHLGPLPTPALTHYALRHQRASIMVTGSHIPFDRNGIKFNKPDGEVLKRDEPGILQAVQRVRNIEYNRTSSRSLFDDHGMFHPGATCGVPDVRRDLPDLPPRTSPLTPAASRARREYTLRYLDFFAENCLQGMRVVFYQHSSVARDLLPELLSSLGALVILKGRSETFVPVDTEALAGDQLATLQHLADETQPTHGPIDAIISTDGDGDRPLVAVDAHGKVRFIPGDVLGIMVAEFLGADVIVVPISANDAVDRWAAAHNVAVFKTRIGSPYVIETMQRARTGGNTCVVGWEANGGFLTATDITRNCRTLTALPTRDAALPILAALCSAKEHPSSVAGPLRRVDNLPLVELLAQHSHRFGQSGLINIHPLPPPLPSPSSANIVRGEAGRRERVTIDAFPPQLSGALLRRFSPAEQTIMQVEFEEDTTDIHPLPPPPLSPGQHFVRGEAGRGANITVRLADGTSSTASPDLANSLLVIRRHLERFFSPRAGFDTIARINYLDGIRVYFRNGDIAHLRPSGNAPQMRVYAVADSQARADAIVAMAIREPDGILRQLAAKPVD